MSALLASTAEEVRLVIDTMHVQGIFIEYLLPSLVGVSMIHVEFSSPAAAVSSGEPEDGISSVRSTSPSAFFAFIPHSTTSHGIKLNLGSKESFFVVEGRDVRIFGTNHHSLGIACRNKQSCTKLDRSLKRPNMASDAIEQMVEMVDVIPGLALHTFLFFPLDYGARFRVFIVTQYPFGKGLSVC